MSENNSVEVDALEKDSFLKEYVKNKRLNYNLDTLNKEVASSSYLSSKKWQQLPIKEATDGSDFYKCVVNDLASFYTHKGELISSQMVTYPGEFKDDFASKLNDYVVNKLGGHLLYRAYTGRNKIYDLVYLFEHGCLRVAIAHPPSNQKDKSNNITNVSLDTLFMGNNFINDAVLEFISSVKTASVSKKSLNMVCQNKEGMYLKKVNKSELKFEEENYLPEVVKQYQSVLKEFSKETPFARMVIMNGLPGSGKSSLIKCLINDLQEGKFILIPSNMIQNLDGPSLADLLLRENKDNLPIFLILEDADVALSIRDRKNMASLSTLLNLTDGAFGNDELNCRVIATTNADKLDIDPAAMRAGRLLCHIHVDSLPEKQAKKVFARLTDLDPEEDEEFESLCVTYELTGPKSLADVYLAFHKYQESLTL